MCEKRAYRTAKAANAALARIKQRPPYNSNGKMPRRRYECSECGFWHLTSQTKIEYWASLSDKNTRNYRKNHA